jgi:F-type H+-transporting ATPase subunit b
VRRGARAAALALLGVSRPALARAAGGEEAEGGRVLLFEWVNLLLLIAVLVYFGRKPVSTFLAERRGAIERDLNGAQELLRDAQSRLRDWTARAAQIEGEVAEIQRVAREAAEQEAARIVADARTTAERIRRDAAAAVRREGERARARLRREAADLAVESAERLLRAEIQPADGDRLFEEFVARIEGPAAGRRN